MSPSSNSELMSSSTSSSPSSRKKTASLAQGAVSAAKSAASSAHGKLHKRGNSASSLNTAFARPKMSHSYSIDSADIQTASSTYSRCSHDSARPERPWEDITSAPIGSHSHSHSHSHHHHLHHPRKIKPYLRKFSTQDTRTIDLSLPAAENESITGLGIQDPAHRDRAASDVSSAPIGMKNRHNRSVSGTSGYSSNSSMCRPSGTYAHPMRQTPGSWTPPIGVSTPASLREDDIDEEAFLADQELRYRKQRFDPARRSDSTQNSTRQPSLRINTMHSRSQSSLDILSPVSRTRTDTLKSNECTTPSSRTSLDKAFGFIRDRNSPPDPALRAASIEAARLAFQEKEEAKQRKLEQKQKQKEFLKRDKREDKELRRSIDQQRRELRRSYSDEKRGVKEPSPLPDIPDDLPPSLSEPIVPELTEPVTPHPHRTPKHLWIMFLAWLRTRLLRMSRKACKVTHHAAATKA